MAWESKIIVDEAEQNYNKMLYEILENNLKEYKKAASSILIRWRKCKI